MLGENIYNLRRKNGLSQEQFAEKINVTRQTISNWELGETAPNPSQLKLISQKFNISIDELMDNKEFAKKDSVKKHNYSYEYISKTKIKRTPLVHINIGYGCRKAKGIIAIGNLSKGVISIGGISLGVISLGGVSIGLLSAGGLALGLLFALGGLAIGSLAIGGVALGLFALGGLAIGIYSIGGFAIAKNVASGDHASGYIAIGNNLKGAITLYQKDVSSAQIRKSILEHFPKTWDIIVTILSNITFR